MSKEAEHEVDRVLRQLLDDGEPEAELPECCRRKHREIDEQTALIQRLNRMEGQIRGIRGMVEKEAYCVDILQQVSAVQYALKAFSREVLASHVRTCVVQDIRGGNDEAAEELLSVIQKFM